MSRKAPEDFAGFRCIVEYPVWQTEYRVYFFEKSKAPRGTERG